jgi:hypothetical protein
MEDSPEDLPKPPRRTAARPFFSPRPNSGEGVTGPLELSRRRAAQLFTPPGSAPATTPAQKTQAEEPSPTEHSAAIPTSAAADGSSEAVDAAAAGRSAEPELSTDVDFEGDWTPAPMLIPEQTLDADSLLASRNLADDDHQLVVEQFEHEEIELKASGSNVPDEHAIEVIAYDDANSLLKATASDGEDPAVDGLQLESTEFSFESAGKPPRMNVDSFWASEPFAAADAPPDLEATPVADETEATIDEATAGEHEQAFERAGTEPSIDAQPFEWADDPSTTIAHAQAAAEPEPEHEPLPAPVIADISPPWMSRLTPASSQSLEELKGAEPWSVTPTMGIDAVDFARSPDAAAPAADASRVEARTDVQPPSAYIERATSAAPASASEQVAGALERIAARVRVGEIDVPAASELSDEAALSAVLTALLRLR